MPHSEEVSTASSSNLPLFIYSSFLTLFSFHMLPVTNSLSPSNRPNLPFSIPFNSFSHSQFHCITFSSIPKFFTQHKTFSSMLNLHFNLAQTLHVSLIFLIPNGAPTGGETQHHHQGQHSRTVRHSTCRLLVRHPGECCCCFVVFVSLLLFLLLLLLFCLCCCFVVSVCVVLYLLLLPLLVSFLGVVVLVLLFFVFHIFYFFCCCSHVFVANVLFHKRTQL